MKAHERQKAARPPGSDSTADTYEGAVRYRRLIKLVAAQVALVLLDRLVALQWPRVPNPQTGPLIVKLALTAGTVVVGAFALAATYSLAQWLRKPAPVLWLLGVMVPCVGLFVLIALCRDATREFARAGIPVGLMGPKLEHTRT